jgi:tight adherence protein C
MQGLLDFYASLGELGPLVIAGVLGLVLILIALPVMLKKQIDPMAKFRQNVKQPQQTGKNQFLRTSSKADKLEKFKEFLEPKSEEEYSATKLKLLQAGYRGKNAVSTYHFAQFALGAGFLLLGVGYAIYYSFASQEPTPTQIAFRAIIPGLVGYYLPKYWVTKRQQTRQENITNGFPDALDLMLVCVEAGQSLDQSILRVSKEIRSGFPDLADEFEMISQETKAGKDKTEVLRDMSERCGVQDVSSFVTVLIQSATFGTSIADALRIYASEMRDKRVMRAEEKANTLPTKMTLATMMLTVPPLLVILIGPSIYEIAETLGGAQFF